MGLRQSGDLTPVETFCQRRFSVWRVVKTGSFISLNPLSAGVGQIAKIRKDASGFVLCTTGFGTIGGSDVNTVVLIKISSALELEWSEVSQY